MSERTPVWHFSHDRDIETIYILWNHYKQNYLKSPTANDLLELGIPQSLAYLQHRLNVSLKDLNDFSFKYYGHSFSGMDSINPDKIGEG